MDVVRWKMGTRDKENFAVGSIIRIKLTNFLTYDHVELFPGPNLNVIIGPNGTGKSSVVCAICLGLGGNPSVIGRSTEVKDFVKHGQDLATIEIELRIEENKAKLVVYKIRKEGSNEFFIDGQKKSKQQVVQMAQSYKIQVDNLCQFLAQDRVVEFSKISMQHLLTSTEKAVSSELLEQHELLKSKQGTGGEYKHRLDALERDKAQLDTEVTELEPRYRAYHEYQTRQEKIKHLEQKRAWLEYEDERKKYAEAKNKLEVKQEELRQKKQKMEPEREAVRQLKTQVETQAGRMAQLKEELTRSCQRIDRQSDTFERIDEEVKRIRDTLAGSLDREKQQQDMIETVETAIKCLERDIKEVEAEKDLQPLLKEKRSKYAEIREEMDDFERSGRELQEQRSKFGRMQEGVRAELRQMRDLQHLRLNSLRHMNENAYRLWCWYLENKQEFAKPIYIPLLSVALKNPSDAKFIENVVGDRDLQMFVCGSNQDNAKLVSKMKQMHVFANATVVSDSAQINRYELSRQMKQVGFRSFLLDMVEAPREVIQYLCNVNHINRIPVGTERSEAQMENVQQVLVNEKMFLALTENKRISIKQSRYTGDCSVSDNPLREERWLKSSVAANDEQELLKQDKEIGEELARIEGQKGLLAEQITDLRRQAEMIGSEMENLKQMLRRPAQLRGQYRSKIEELRSLKSRCSRFDEQKAKAKESVQVLVDKKLAVGEEVSGILANFEDKIQQRIKTCLDKADMVSRVQEITEQIKEAESSLKHLQEEIDQIEEVMRNKRVELRHAMKTISDLCGLPANLQPTTHEERTRQAEVFQMMKSLPNRIEEVEKAISEEKGRQDVGGRVDRQIVKEFEQKKARSIELEKSLEALKEKIENFDKEVGEIKESWLRDLEALVQTISKNFSHFFRILGCAGEVVVDREGPEEDFANYGIGINVKFRDNEPIRRLTHQHQSGGERSVATMLYMLALQELSEVPFRCVDEINQGMDPVNERKVFEMVVNLLSGEWDSEEGSQTNLTRTQYFMLTPKLLPNLAFSKKMTVLIVHNGSGMIDGSRWKLGNFVDKRRTIVAEKGYTSGVTTSSD